MARRVCYFEYSLFRKQWLHFISSNNISLLQGLNCEVLSRVSILWQYYFAEMSTAEYGEQSKVLQGHTSELRMPSWLVGAISILQGSSWHFVNNLKDKVLVETANCAQMHVLVHYYKVRYIKSNYCIREM